MGKIKEDFLSVRSFITLGAFFTVYALVWFKLPIPDILKEIINLLLGFWFGSKVANKGEQNGGAK